MKKLILTLLFFLITKLTFSAPVTNYSEEITNFNGTKTLNIFSYPKYYRNNERLEAIDINITASLNPNWNWQVNKGVYKLFIKNDGTFEFNHLGDIVKQKIVGIGFFNSNTKERIVKSNFILSNPIINGNEISWSLPFGCSYKIIYIEDNLKDIMTLSQQAKEYLKNNSPTNWTVQNTWICLIYDMDLSQSTLIESKDFETNDDIKFIKDGQIKHKIKEATVKHKDYPEKDYDLDTNGNIVNDYTNLRWKKKKFYKNGKYIEMIPVSALLSQDGELIFNTDVTFQNGVSPDASYAGCDDTSIGFTNNADNNYGTSTTDNLTNQFAAWNRRILYKFDLSSIPSNATVSSATFSTYYNSNEGFSFTMSVYRVLRAWTEGGATGNKYDGTNSWGTQGCNNTTTDRSATSSGSYSYTAWEGAGFKAMTITTAIQNWVDGTWTNNGMILFISTGNNLDGATCISSENTTTENRPKLTVTYTTPVTRRIWTFD